MIQVNKITQSTDDKASKFNTFGIEIQTLNRIDPDYNVVAFEDAIGNTARTAASLVVDTTKVAVDPAFEDVSKDLIKTLRPGGLNKLYNKDGVKKDIFGAISPSSFDKLATDISTTMEAFDGQNPNNPIYLSLVTTYAVMQGDPFINDFYPIMPLDMEQSHITIQTPVTALHNPLSERDVDGYGKTPDKLFNRLLLSKNIYSDVFTSTSNKCIPVYDVTNAAHANLFYTNVATVIDNTSGKNIETLPLKVNTLIDIISISKTSAEISKGVSDGAESLVNSVKLTDLFFTLNKTVAGAPVTETFKIDVRGIDSATFSQSTIGEERDYLAHINTNVAVFSLEPVNSEGGASAILTDVGLANYKVRLALEVIANVNLESGGMKVSPAGKGVSFVALHDGTNTQLAATATASTDVKALFDTAEIVGYHQDSYRTNSDLRTAGLTFTVINKQAQLYAPYKSGSTAYTPIVEFGTSNDANRLNGGTLPNITLIQMHNAAVDQLLRTERTLSSVTSNGTLVISDTTQAVLGLGSYHVTPTYTKDTLDLSAFISSVKSSERKEDIKAAITQKLVDVLLHLGNVSNYFVSSMLLHGSDETTGAIRTTNVVLVCDQYIYNYLDPDQNGEIRVKDFTIRCSKTLNPKMAGKIYFTFGGIQSATEVSNNVVTINPISGLGLTIVRPTIVSPAIATRTSNGGSLLRSDTFPCWEFHNTNPVLGRIDVANITEALAKITFNTHAV